MPQSKEKHNFFSRIRYQYEVTLGLYMLTTTEKIVLSSPSEKPELMVDCIFVSILSMLILSTWFYLPSHIAAISRHVQYYLAYEEEEGLLQDIR
jgi:hypothetical protein